MRLAAPVERVTVVVWEASTRVRVIVRVEVDVMVVVVVAEEVWA